MPALRSPWFGVHIGAASISYASFVLAGCAGLKYLLSLKKGETEDSPHLKQIDFFSYRLIALGILMLTIVILSGMVWAEQAWSSFWSWDPKELWSLITWIVYSIYLHQRLRKKWQGKRMAIFAIIAVGVILFTFIGVNTLLPGLHSYR
jgi:cytochrome c-type biogenesis protein CcsB